MKSARKTILFPLGILTAFAGVAFALSYPFEGIQPIDDSEQRTESFSLGSLIPGAEASSYFNNSDLHDFFKDYASWPSTTSGTQFDPTYFFFTYLAEYPGLTTPYTSSSQKHTAIDINGDSLVDILFHDYSNDHQGNGTARFVAFLNDGAGSFTVAYKCYRQIQSTQVYSYGDCATTRSYTGPKNFGSVSSPTSSTPKADDMNLRVLRLMATVDYYQIPGGTTAYTQQPVTLTDINGDGLTDMLYHTWTGPENSIKNHYYGIMLNRGNMTFEITYRCYLIDQPSSADTYKGDCAST